MEILTRLATISFEPSDVFSWNPVNGCITYDPRRLHTAEGRAFFLHELAHALLDHTPHRTLKSKSQMEWEADRLAEVLDGLI